MLAIGRALTPMTSRTTPPTPVLAPPKGSSAEGWLCVSTLKARSLCSSKAMMPALSTKAERTQGLAGSLGRGADVGLAAGSRCGDGVPATGVPSGRLLLVVDQRA